MGVEPGVVRFATGVSIVDVANDGSMDVGLGGDLISNGDIHA